MAIVNAIVARREQELVRFYKDMTFDEKRDLIVSGLRNKLSKHAYADLAIEFGIEIVWGEGGAQTKKIKEFKEYGTPFVHIPSYKYSASADAKAIREAEGNQ